jgi:cardiolipin synthase
VNFPNLITLLRLLLVPVTVWLIISDAYALAFCAFLIAGVSDAVDGHLARRMNLQTKIGTYLDPLADKALMVSVYVTLGFLKVLPAWLVILVVSRDVLIVGAIILAWLVAQPLRVSPLMVSKINTVAQVLFVVAVLGAAAFGAPLDLLVFYGSIPVALLTAASGGAYLLTWMRHMGETPPEDRKP